MAVSPRLPRALQGAPDALAFASLDQLRLRPMAGAPGGLPGRRQARSAFDALYAQGGDEPVSTSGKEAFAALDLLERKIGQNPPPSTAQYPNGPIASSLRQLAQLIKAEVGLRVGCADAGGWDTHVDFPAHRSPRCLRYNPPLMPFFIAAILALTPVTAEQAKQAFPAVDLSDLSDQQRGTFIDVAADVFNYAGCQDTLAICLNPRAKDPHALRMAALVHQLVKDGVPADLVVQVVEKYYASFAPRARLNMRTDNCAVEGTGPISIVEFSDYQCPHCAAALPVLTALATTERKDQVRLCSKYFPFSSHPRARVAALCAEYARSKGRFWEMNAVLFRNQEALDDGDLKKYAQQIGLDGDEMLKEAYSGRFDAVVEKHIREGAAAGVESTPTLFIDGRMNHLPMRPWYLNFTVDDELQWKKEKGWKFGPAPPDRKVAKRK